MNIDFNSAIFLRLKFLGIFIADSVLVVLAVLAIRLKIQALDHIHLNGIENDILRGLSYTLDIVIVLFVIKSIIRDLYCEIVVPIGEWVKNITKPSYKDHTLEVKDRADP